MIGETKRINNANALRIDVSGAERFPIKIISDYRAKSKRKTGGL